MEDFTCIELSELDQIMPRLYVRWLLCIPMPKDSPSKQAIATSLQKGMDTAVSSLPMLAGTIVPTPSDSSRLEIHIAKTTPALEVKIQHLDDEKDDTMPTYQQLEEAEFPMSALPNKILTPVDIQPLPTFQIMATFIRGGMMLMIKIHHAVVDGAGMGLLIKFMAEHCHAAFEGTTPQIAVPSIDRSILPTGTEPHSSPNVGFSVAEPVDTSKPAKVYAAMTNLTFKFSSEALQKLKAACMPTPEVQAGIDRVHGAGPAFVTTHDALTALLYAAVSYARGIRLTKELPRPSVLPSVMGVAVNGRPRLQPTIPTEYSGNVSLYATYSSPIVLPVSTIPDISFQDFHALVQRLQLPKLAAQTHDAVAAVKDDFAITAIAQAKAVKDITTLKPDFGNTYQGTDFFITSGADFRVFDKDWWPGGKVDALRIPLNLPWDGSCGILATTGKTKGLDIVIGLREDDMEIFKTVLAAFGGQVVWPSGTFK